MSQSPDENIIVVTANRIILLYTGHVHTFHQCSGFVHLEKESDRVAREVTKWTLNKTGGGVVDKCSHGDV